MKLIVGLGNPGSEYSNTRHNIGFIVLDWIASNLQANQFSFNKKFEAEIAEAKFDNHKCFLLKPRTFMNCSGEAVSGVFDYYKLKAEDLFLIYDDLDLPFGKIRIRTDGGSGGHNGIKSIQSAIKQTSFVRIKIGIGRPDNPNFDSSDWVLSKFSSEELKAMDSICEKVFLALKKISSEGVVAAQNEFN